MLGSLTYAIIEGPTDGWHSPGILALFAVAVVCLAVFVVYEARRTEPVLDPRFFRSAPFAGAVLTAISAFAALGGFLFLATLYLQDVRDMSALVAGLHMVPMAALMAVGAVVSSRVLARRAGGCRRWPRARGSRWEACCCPGSPRRGPRCRSSSRSASSASGPAWSTRRSPRRRCRACPSRRPEWPRV